MSTRLIVLAAVCVLCIATAASAAAASQPNPSKPQYTSDLTVWPNKVSSANSDEWLVKNHDKIKKMEPRALFLNFSNGFSMEKAEAMAKLLLEGLTEGTKFHGYKNPKAKPFVEWKLLKIVDLRDKEPYPETPDGNSTKYPRKPNSAQGMNFDYKQLYSEKFAEYYGFKDPDNPNRYLTLAELVKRGIIHELYFFAYQRNAGAPFEATELKPVYDENFKRKGNEYRAAGNGGDPEEPWYGRSLRISFVNAERGVGCNIESMSHSFEGMAHSRCIPYLTKYFYEFAGFDLDKRYGLPFNSLYALWGEGKYVEYPTPTSAVIHDGEKTYKIDNYVAIGGNVHFTPNGRSHYDLSSPYTVMSTIEHYRLHDGPDGKDKAEPWTIAKFSSFGRYGDCMGPWLVYWRQNFPNYKSKSVDDNGKPMKNWWPFLFY